MKKRFFGILLMMAMFATLAAGWGSAEQVKAASTTYYFSNLSYNSKWGVSDYSVSDGALKTTFSSLYGEIKYNFPEEISISELASISVGANTGGQNVAFKFYDASGNQLFVKYNANCSSYTDFYVSASGSGSIRTIGVMSQSESSFTATTYNIKLEFKNSSTSTATLKEAMSGTFGKVGAAVTPQQLRDSATLAHIKEHYNSITMENEMKPDAIMTGKIAVEEARNKGYMIPDGYAESYVPALNFTTVDEVLKTAHNNGLSLRFHTLIWHKQMPKWFFKYSYNENYDYCNEATMNKRVEFYVKNVVAHVCQSDYADVVYAYDVVNEYFHNADAGTSHWTQIYGEEGENPSYVKAAFRYASDILNEYGRRAKVKLFYNDYNTYLISDQIVNLINNINSGSALCDGVGMQSHLDVDWPDAAFIGTTIDKFKNAGLEIQITELDATINARKDTYTLEDQSNYYYSFMRMLREKKNAGAKITSVTFWGLHDSVSWRASGKPLLFSQLGVKKPAYDSVIQAMS